MKKHVAIALAATALIGPSAFAAASDSPRSHKHAHRARQPAHNAERAAPDHDEGRGPFSGAGGIYSRNYETPGAPVYHLGGQLLGGDFGKAYEDYYRHYYYYKYAYCPLGSEYVIYLRRCVGPLDLFR